MIDAILLTVVTVLCAAGMVMMFKDYRRDADARSGIFLSVIVVVLIEAWIDLGGIRLPDGLARWRFALVLIPAAVILTIGRAEGRKNAAKKVLLSSAAKNTHIPAVIEDVLKNPEKLEIMKDMLENPQKVRLGGRKKNLAIMFTDVRGFTELSEKLSPEQLILFLNEYLDEMSRIILANQGVVDKYIGDAIMAFWGEPLDDPDHVLLAVKAAVEMEEHLKRMRVSWQERGLPDMQVGIGINAGDVIVGNIGCDRRFDYTCVGDQVNLAARLEAFNKIYGTSVIISEPVHRILGSAYVCRELDVVSLPNRPAPMVIYEVMGKSVDQKTRAFLHYYAEAFALYRKRRWSEARDAFEKAVKLKRDKPASVHIAHCAQFEKSPPPPEWNGAIEVDVKQ